jgi:hypothetical protein
MLRWRSEEGGRGQVKPVQDRTGRRQNKTGQERTEQERRVHMPSPISSLQTCCNLQTC